MGNVAGGVDRAEVAIRGGFADGLVGLGVLREGDEEAVGAQDAGFFAGDGGDGVAEVVLMVEGDVGEDGEEGLDDVGGVETAAEADFKDGDVDLLLGEVGEGYGGDEAETAEREDQDDDELNDVDKTLLGLDGESDTD